MVFTPKGWDNIARGNAPGRKGQHSCSLKGCDTAHLSQPFRLENHDLLDTQGFALGYVVPPLRGEDSEPTLTAAARPYPGVPMRTLRLFALVALLAPLGGGCKWLDDMKGRGGDQSKKGTGPLPTVSPEQLVGYLNDHAARLQSIQYGDVRVRCFDKGMPMPALDGNLACAQPRSFRMVGAGRAVAAKIDLGSNPDQFWVYVQIPTEKPMYVFASHTDFETGRAKLPGGIPFEPDWVMQSLGMITFPPTNPYKVEINDRDRTYTLWWNATLPSGTQVRKEVVFDGDSARDPRPQVKKHVIKDAKGSKVLAYAEVKQAKTATSGTDPRNPVVSQAVQYPTQVVLKWEEQKFEMDLTLENAQVNQGMPPDLTRQLFTKPTIPNVPSVNLAEFKFN